MRFLQSLGGWIHASGIAEEVAHNSIADVRMNEF
jgi:hypothetical protein